MYGTQICVMRIFNTYGPHMLSNDCRVVSKFIVKPLRSEPLTLCGSGSQIHLFCFLDDLIESMIRPKNGNHCGPINIGSPCEFKIRRLAELICVKVNPKLELIDRTSPLDYPRQRQLVIRLAQGELSCQPTVPFEQGLDVATAHLKEDFS